MALFHKLLLFFLASTAVLYLGTNFLFPQPIAAPVVHAPAGKVAGHKLVSRSGRGIHAYQGIPFAKPPIGPLRFARPLPLSQPWQGVHDGTKNAPQCVQPGVLLFNLGQEDCLYLNVYVPQLTHVNDQTQLPVMVNIHGGGFMTGEASDFLYGPRYLLDHDVILVTIQYRLGPFGFLNLGYGEQAGGNQGLWDQREALSWVQKNIASFGGDPDLVTLLGESAGSMSVMLHMVSNQAEQGQKPLFHAAIAQSGPIDSSFMRQDQDAPLVDYHRQYALEMGCKSLGNSQELLECLQSKSTDELMSKNHMFDECNLLEILPFPGFWSPSNDASFSNNPFFLDNPLKMSHEGRFMKDVPLMIGSTKHEGLFTTGMLLKQPENFRQLIGNFDVCMATNMFAKRKKHISDRDIQLVGKIKDFYFGDQQDYQLELNLALEQSGVDGIFRNWTNAFTDSMFAYGTDSIVSTFTSETKTPVYYYRFDHIGSFSSADFFSDSPLQFIVRLFSKLLGYHTTKGLGVCHADDIMYIFSSKLPFMSADTDQDTSRLMVDLWTNFATHHDPTPASLSSQKWKPATMEKKTMARIENGQLNFDRDMDYENRMDFWENVIYKTK